MIDNPVDPISAVTAADPGRIYIDLARRKSLVWNDLQAMWIAAHPDVVWEVLHDPICQVRPRQDPVPTALGGSIAGMIFGQWARMREGQDHQRVRAALAAGLDSVDQDVVREAAELAAA